jgi:hypothetical protein
VDTNVSIGLAAVIFSVDFENGDGVFLRNVGIAPQGYAMTKPRISQFEYSLP